MQTSLENGWLGDRRLNSSSQQEFNFGYWRWELRFCCKSKEASAEASAFSKRKQVRLASVETSVFSKFPSVFSKCLSVTSVQAVEGVECFGVH